MTTIVFDGVQLASDTRRQVGCIEAFNTEPKFAALNGVVFAGSGVDVWHGAFMAWYCAKRRGKYPLRTKTDSDVDSDIAVFARGAWWRYHADAEFPERMAAKWAIGTGAGYALAALLCGRDAPSAVEIAMQLDTSSGGKIFTADLTRLVKFGNVAIQEWTRGVQADRKPNGAARALHARKGRANSRAVFNGRSEH